MIVYVSIAITVCMFHRYFIESTLDFKVSM